MLVKGCLNPRGGRADDGPSIVRLGKRGREAELTPRVVAGRGAITHLENPDRHLCIPAQARSARTPRPPLSHGPPRNCGGGGVSKESSGRHVSFSPGSWKEGQPRVPHVRLLRCSLLVSRAAHDSDPVNSFSLADLARSMAAAAEVRFANPLPQRKSS